MNDLPTNQTTFIPSPSDQDRAPADPIEFPDGRLNVQYLLKNASILLEGGELRLARGILYRLLSQGERLHDVHSGLAKTFSAEKRWDESACHLEQSIAFLPSRSSYLELANVLAEARKFQAAAQALERALYLRNLSTEESLELHLEAAKRWLAASSPSSAQKHYEAALRLQPASDAVRSDLGELALQQKNPSTAKRYFLEAIALNAKSPLAWSGLGQCALLEQDLRAAHDAFSKSLDIDISNTIAIYHLIKIAYELKSYATATRLLEKYVDSSPINLNLLYSLGGLQLQLGRTRDVRETCSRILSLDKDHEGAKDLLLRIEGMFDQ